MQLTPEFLARLQQPRGLSMVQAMALDPMGTLYTFVDTKTNTAIHIAAAILLRAAQRVGCPVTDCQIGGTLADALKRGDLGVEEPHALSLPQEALKAPALIGEWDDGHVVIDGAHRLWRRWKDGMTTFPAYVIPEALWREFVVYDMPGEAAFWENFNRTAQIRTPAALAYLQRLIGQCS